MSHHSLIGIYGPKQYFPSILDAQPVPGSALNDLEVRKMMMETVKDRNLFDLALRHTYAYLGVPQLARMFNIGEGDADDGADGIHNARQYVVCESPVQYQF